MPKKNKSIESEDTGRIRLAKSRKPQSKEMFVQLKTHEEHKISKTDENNMQRSVVEEMIDQADSHALQNIADLGNSKNQQDLDQVCTIVHNLILKNKINAKNAFEVPFIDIEKLQDFDKINQSENGWRKISSTLENDSKIYSYRVDAIHSIAYKIMNTMTRNQDSDPSKDQEQSKKPQPAIDKIMLPIVDEFDVSVGVHLQKNVQNINMQSLERLWQFNPTYERTRRRFDQTDLKGILLNNIPLDTNLELTLNETRKSKPNGFYSEAMPVKVDKLSQELGIFKQTEDIRKQLCNTLKQQYVSSHGLGSVWKKILDGHLQWDSLDDVNKDHEIDFQNEAIKQEVASGKRVQDIIKLKSKKSTSKKEVNLEDVGWLSEVDKKMLGLIKSQSTSTVKKVESFKQERQRNQDDVDFNINQKVEKKIIFSEDTIEKQKNEYQQQIQQKHLLPLRLFHKFKVEQVLTLRQEPPEAVQDTNLMDAEEGFEKEREFQQIDIKRQQMSIRQSKQKLSLLIKKESNFLAICRNLQALEKNMTPELCFLTVLHLANENNLKLDQISQSNFRIKF